MPTQTLTTVSMPRELIEEVDRLVGPERRTKFLVEAAEEKLGRARLARLAREAAGSLADLDIPGWENPEAVAEWVRSMRRTCDCPPDVSSAASQT